MKIVFCTTWMLGALLVMATLDAQPDPAAVNPGSNVRQVLQLHHYSCDTAAWRCDSIGTCYPSSPASLATAHASESYHPSDPPVFTGQAGDPSPPAPRHQAS